MNNVVRIIPKTEVENTSIAVLKEAIEMNPDTVICFCFDGSSVHIKASGIKSNLELIGALEAAKQQIWSNA